MDPRDAFESGQFATLTGAFGDQLAACLEECERGRQGLFSSLAPREPAEKEDEWPEAARLRELALAVQAILSQNEERDALVDEFLDLCTIHGESDPGERRLARAFLERIEKNEVGTPLTGEKAPW